MEEAVLLMKGENETAELSISIVWTLSMGKVRLISNSFRPTKILCFIRAEIKTLFLMHVVLLGCGLFNLVFADPLTLPLNQRPEWLRQEGIVMAGSWEPLIFRVRRDGNTHYTPTPEQRASTQREYSSEMVAQLNNLGVNFVMMHCYKGFGLKAEAESMADAVRFSKLCHDGGLHVGVYAYSGALGWELFFKEVPEAKDWIILDPEGQPVMYDHAPYRYYWNRNHPDAQAFYKNIIRFAIQNIQTDLIHFDNYSVGPGWDKHSVQRFRDYLRNTFTPHQLDQMGIKDLSSILPPRSESSKNFLYFAWLDFVCKSLAESYQDMSQYARTLRKDISMECNPNGIQNRIYEPIDHDRILLGGEAFWDEGISPGFKEGKLHTRIRTYKVARRMDNMAFAYCTTPLELAESMAFNLDCLGCIGWFEYGNLVEKPGSTKPISGELAPFIRFYHSRRELFHDARVIADIAVLRSFSSQLFAEPKYSQLTNETEESFIKNRIPFQIIFDSHLNELRRYRVLVLAGCVALSDSQIVSIKRYVEEGGRLFIVGPVAVYDEWMTPRKDSILTGLPQAQVVCINQADDFLNTFNKAYRNILSMVVETPVGLCCELTEQSDRELVHLVNYRNDETIKNVMVKIRLPIGKWVKRVILAGPQRESDTQISFEVKKGIVSFTLPQIKIYEIATIQFQ